MARWGERTPRVIWDGCFLYPDAVPIWLSFQRLCRGRNYAQTGHPLPLKYRDIRDEAARHACRLDVEQLEVLLEALDDIVLAFAAKQE